MLIRTYQARDATAVRALFIAVNRAMAPEAMCETFEAYIEQSLREEIDRIEPYYSERNGSFWVAEEEGELVGMFGLEQAGAQAAELRRMYVAPAARRRGIARAMLAHAEETARRSGCRRLVLSTSELQPAALALYRASGFTLLREELAQDRTNKTVGGGLRRFYFSKQLSPAATV